MQANIVLCLLDFTREGQLVRELYFQLTFLYKLPLFQQRELGEESLLFFKLFKRSKSSNKEIRKSKRKDKDREDRGEREREKEGRFLLFLKRRDRNSRENNKEKDKEEKRSSKRYKLRLDRSRNIILHFINISYVKKL